MQNIISLLLLLSSMILFSCGDEATEKKSKSECKYAAPTAIFLPTNKEVEKTDFKIENKVGIENVIFRNGLKLELLQSGCNDIKQDFTFTVPMANKDAEEQFWILKASQLMQFLGNSDLSMAQMQQWATVLQQSAPEMYIGQEFEIQSGFFITVDKISGGEETIIKVILEGKG